MRTILSILSILITITIIQISQSSWANTACTAVGIDCDKYNGLVERMRGGDTGRNRQKLLMTYRGTNRCEYYGALCCFTTDPVQRLFAISDREKICGSCPSAVNDACEAVFSNCWTKDMNDNFRPDVCEGKTLLEARNTCRVETINADPACENCPMNMEKYTCCLDDQHNACEAALITCLETRCSGVTQITIDDIRACLPAGCENCIDPLTYRYSCKCTDGSGQWEACHAQMANCWDSGACAKNGYNTINAQNYCWDIITKNGSTTISDTLTINGDPNCKDCPFKEQFTCTAPLCYGVTKTATSCGSVNFATCLQGACVNGKYDEVPLTSPLYPMSGYLKEKCLNELTGGQNNERVRNCCNDEFMTYYNAEKAKCQPVETEACKTAKALRDGLDTCRAAVKGKYDNAAKAREAGWPIPCIEFDWDQQYKDICDSSCWRTDKRIFPVTKNGYALSLAIGDWTASKAAYPVMKGVFGVPAGSCGSNGVYGIPIDQEGTAANPSNWGSDINYDWVDYREFLDYMVDWQCNGSDSAKTSFQKFCDTSCGSGACAGNCDPSCWKVNF